MKKNYSMPQLEVSEMKAGALLAASSTGGSTQIGQSTTQPDGTGTGSGVKGQVESGTPGEAKIAPNHFEF